MSDVTKLGVLLDETAQRDAIHIAVAPVVAAHRLIPGLHVGLMPDGTASVVADNLIGIADPFLRSVIEKGDRFWLFLYPNTITSLRHQWTHPAFENAPRIQEISSGISSSVAWLTAFATSQGDTYDSLMEVTGELVAHGIIGTSSFSSYILTSEFWDHYEAVTGRRVADRAEYFRCTC